MIHQMNLWVTMRLKWMNNGVSGWKRGSGDSISSRTRGVSVPFQRRYLVCSDVEAAQRWQARGHLNLQDSATKITLLVGRYFQTSLNPAKH
jgi:hypothetical protein